MNFVLFAIMDQIFSKENKVVKKLWKIGMKYWRSQVKVPFVQSGKMGTLLHMNVNKHTDKQTDPHKCEYEEVCNEKMDIHSHIFCKHVLNYCRLLMVKRFHVTASVGSKFEGTEKYKFEGTEKDTSLVSLHCFFLNLKISPGATKFWPGNMFTLVCLSVHRGVYLPHTPHIRQTPEA